MLEQLEPKKVFEYFEKICEIPHGSGNTKALSDFIVNFAKERGLNTFQDDSDNVIVYKPGVKEGADKEPVIIQGHIDMVCEKNFETNARFDFEKDPLQLRVMDDYIFAKGTTLGGDDGIAVAYMMALLDENDEAMPPLECVFTSDEEIGMIGANKLDFSKLSGKKLINIDNEKEGEFLTSCAGGQKAACNVPVRFVERIGIKYEIVVCGLLGGHSGTEINKYRGNANLIMGRLLNYIGSKMYFDLITVNGGLQDNAIPRECKAEILVNEADIDTLENLISEFEDTMKNEYRKIETDLTVYCINNDEFKTKVLTPKTKERVVFLLMTLPDGVQKMSPDDDNLVQTSCNIGIIKMLKDSFEVILSLRSSVTSEKEALSTKIQYLTETIGGKYTASGKYPAWEYCENSKLRNMFIEKYETMYGKKATVCGLHAGLETGIFFQNIKGIDIAAVGPDIEDIHTPKEKLSISSTERVYKLIKAVLYDLAKA